LTYKHSGGLDYEDYVKFAMKADLLVHDSQYRQEEYKRKETWGHSCYNDALKLAIDSDVKKYGIFHHDPERTDNEVLAIEDECRNILKEINSDIECFAVHDGMEVTL
jgi:ribonuclease BN (tRNA processing enzyme)